MCVNIVKRWPENINKLQRTLPYMYPGTRVHDFSLEFYSHRWNLWSDVYVSSTLLCQTVFQNFVLMHFPMSSL